MLLLFRGMLGTLSRELLLPEVGKSRGLGWLYVSVFFVVSVWFWDGGVGMRKTELGWWAGNHEARMVMAWHVYE